MRADIRQMVLAHGSVAGRSPRWPRLRRTPSRARSAAWSRTRRPAARSRRHASSSPAPTGSRPRTGKAGSCSATWPPGSTQVRVLRLGYAPVTDTAVVAPGETVALEIAMTPAPVQLDEIVTTATGEQRKLEVANAVSTIDAARHRRGGADRRVRQPDQRTRGRRAGAEDGRDHRHRHPHPDPRLQQRLASATSRSTTSTASAWRAAPPPARSTSAGSGGRGRGAVAHQRPQPRRHRVHRDREGAGGGDALRHPGLQRGRPDHDQARARGQAALESVRRDRARFATRTPIRSTSSARRRQRDPDLDGFCIVQFELDGDCTQTSVEQFSPLEDPRRGPFKTGLRQQYGANVSGGTEQITYYLSGDYENEEGVYRLPQFEEDSIRGALGDGARHPAPPQRARAGEPARQHRRQPLGRRRPPGQRGLHLERHPVRRERQQLPHHHRQRRGERRRLGRRQPRLVLHPRRSCSPSWPSSPPSASSADSPATGVPPTGSPPGPPWDTTSPTGRTCSSSPPARWRTTSRTARA